MSWQPHPPSILSAEEIPLPATRSGNFVWPLASNYPGSQNDGLRLLLGGSEVVSLRVVGAIPGVVIVAAAGRNGPGAGLLTVSPPNLLTWQAPGSATPGMAMPAGSDGYYLLQDGDDPSMWVRVKVIASYLQAAGQAQVYLLDSYSAAALECGGDVPAASAASGQLLNTAYALTNVTNNTVQSVKLWIDSTASGAAAITISSDGVNFYDPASETDPNVLTWSAVAPGQSVTVWVKRAIGAAAASTPSVLNVLQWAWSALA